MAANEYHNFSTPNGYSSHRQNDHALPPLPIPTSTFSSYDPSQAQTPLSPFDSPTHDPHLIQRYQSRQSPANEREYFGESHGPNSYTDDIPLRSHAQPQTIGDGAAQGDGYPSQEGPTVPQKERKMRPSRRRRKKTGFFSGKVPWVVYGLTLIQVTVFIAEIVRNGKLHRSLYWMSLLRDTSNPDQISDRNTSTSKSHAWSFYLCTHQHGCKVCALHATHTICARLE